MGAVLQAMIAGSSPRGRGTRESQGGTEGRHRFIPAWAGNTSPASPTACPTTVHPRVGGEHPAPGDRDMPHTGSSPRGRGTQARAHRLVTIGRFIPAWAGNTSLPSFHASQNSVHPRVGGEHVNLSGCKSISSGSSPRGRGTHDGQDRTTFHNRFIPAWAGNTPPA